MPRFLTDCVGNAAFCTFGSIQTSALQKPEKYPEMRSAQASFDTRAIMKKFIYVFAICYDSYSIEEKYEQIGALPSNL